MIDVEEIEQEHHKLINMLNSLNDAVNNHDSKNDVYRIIDEITSYTESHFVIEEQLMARSGFPLIELHKDHHKRLINESHRLREKYDEIGEEAFVEWFTHWYFRNFVAHIKYADKPIEDHILQNGVKEFA